MEIHKSLSKENTLPIRGIAAILVLLSHFQLMWPISSIGYLCVAVFFFLSGYGLMYSYNNKPTYLTGFLYRRLPSVILPYWIVCVFYIVFIKILGYNLSNKVTILGILNPFLDTYRYVSVAWYVCVIILFYLLFYFSFKYFKGHKSLFVILLGLCIYGLLAYTYKPIYWSVSFSPFLLGIILCYFKDKIINISNKMSYCFMILTFLTFLVFFIKLPSFTGKQISTILFVLFIVFLLTKVSLKKNKILNFYGKISYEFYLIHPLFIQFVNNDNIFTGPSKGRESCYWPYIFSLQIENKIIQFLLVMLLATIFSYFLNFINNIVLHKYNNRIK